MYKLCKSEQSAQRQRQVEQKLLSMMLVRPYEEIKVSELCDAIPIPRKSFYRYFSCKDGVLHAMIDHNMMDYEGFSQREGHRARRTLADDLESFFDFWVEKRGFLDALAKSGLTGLLIQRSVDYAVSDSVMPRRFLPGELEVMQRHITMFSICGLMSMVVSWHYHGYDYPSREMARIARRMLVEPLFPNLERII